MNRTCSVYIRRRGSGAGDGSELGTLPGVSIDEDIALLWQTYGGRDALTARDLEDLGKLRATRYLPTASSCYVEAEHCRISAATCPGRLPAT